jgi:MFS family permease
MPTKKAATKEETKTRRGQRLAFGVTLAFALAQIFAWPLAYVAPIFTTILLLEPQPLTVRKAFVTFGWALTGLAIGLGVGLTVAPYPGLTVIIFSVFIYWFFYLAMTSGAHLIAVVGALIGTLLMPILSQTFPELPLTAFWGLATNIVIAILCSWVLFLFLPAPEIPSQKSSKKEEKSLEDIHSSALMTTIVIAPLLIAFLVFGWSKILVVIYAALFATTLGAEGGSQAGMKSVAANLFYGAPFAIITYELIVMAPGLGFTLLLVLATCLIFAERIFSDSPKAALWKSGLIGFLLLLGGSLGALAPDTGDKAFDRVLQIAMACAYVIAAYSLIDIVRDIWQAKLVMYIRQSLSHLSPAKIRQLLSKAQSTS